MRSDRTSRRMSGAAWVGVALAMLLAVQAWTSAADAQARSGVAPPPGDCWNGALSNDPLHCYIFEAAQRDGRMEVAAIYVAPGWAPLYVYLKQTAPLSADMGAYFRDKAHEYITDTARSADYEVERCDGTTGEERKRCLDSLVGYPMWRSFDSAFDLGFPDSSVYFAIVLDVGGADGRRSRPGWASWKQLWPVVADGSASGSAAFDVSDVDITTFPKLDCDHYATLPVFPSCHRWSVGSESGFAGKYTDDDKGIIYVQVTTAIPVDETELEALRQRVAPGYEKRERRPRYPGEKRSGGYTVEFVPVKYDFGQLWRWSVILDRFALSAANTIGIEEGEVRTNTGFDYERTDPSTVWLNGAKPSGVDQSHASWNWPAVRNILGVWALDPSVAAAALPRLLPALGIPADAVGVVRGYVRPVGAPVDVVEASVGGETAERAPPPELDCDDDSGAPLLSFCDAW